MKVEPPKLPTLNTCTSIKPLARPTPLPSVEFRLILIPETRKMLKYAFERDTRLMPYLPKETSLSSSSSKFPTITEEEEYKTLSISQPNYSCTTVTPYESIPVDGKVSTKSDAQGREITLSPIEEHPVEMTKKSVPQDSPQDVSSTYDEVRNASIAFINNCDIQNKQKETDPVVCDYNNQELQTTSIGGAETTLANKASHEERQPTEPYKTTLDFEQHLYRPGNLRRNSVPNNRPNRVRPSPYDHPHDLTKTNHHPLLPEVKLNTNHHPLLPWTPEVRRVPMDVVPGGRSVPSIPLVGNLSRHQPYGTPLACLQRGLHTPTTTAPPTRRQTEPLVSIRSKCLHVLLGRDVVNRWLVIVP